MTVYSTVLCGVPVSHRKRIESLVCMGRRMMPSTLQHTVRENITAALPLAAKGGTSVNWMKSLELKTSKHPEKLWNGYISAAQVELQCLQQSCSLSMLHLNESGIHRFRPPGRTCRYAKSNRNPLQKTNGSVHSCHRAQLQSWQGAQLGLS